MSEVPPSSNESRDIDERYRSAAAADAGRPSESARRAILEHASRLAAERAPKSIATEADFKKPAANQPGWRPALFGTLAAAGLAGLLITPRFFQSPAPGVASLSKVERAPEALDKRTEQDAAREQGADSAPELRSDQALRQRPPASPPQAMSAQTQSQPQPPAQPHGMPPALRGAVSGGMADNAAAESRAADRSAAPAAALWRAAQAGDVGAVRALLGRQMDIEARDENGRTALMLATLSGQAGAVDVLLAQGADANAADAAGVTPLRAALAAQEPQIAAALRRAGGR